VIYQFLNFLLSISLLIIPSLVVILIFLKFKDELKSSKFYLLGLVILCVVYLNKLIFFNQTLAAQDFNNIQITFNSFFSESFRNFLTPPLWYTKIGGGLDAFSNPIATYFSPFNFVYLIFSDVYFATNLFILFQIVFLSTTSYLLFRELKFSKALSFFGAVAFTFNGFLVMRLSPGVGVEYLYTYKWIPLILLFSNRIFVEKKYNEILFLGICLGFTFEGNPNIAFGTWCFWFLFLAVTQGKNIFKIWKLFFTAISFGLLFYAIKLVPGIDMMLTSSGRISGTVGGWRTSRMKLYEYLEYFLPLSHKFMTPIFSPGVIVILFFVIGLILFGVKIYKKQELNYLEKFAAISFLIGSVLNTDNPLSEIFYPLPIFNRFTVTPSYLSFLIFPIILIALIGIQFLYTKVSKFKYSYLYLLGISLLVFLEIMLGPSTFGTKTFSFNFAKMDSSEVYKYPHYQEFKKDSSQMFYFNTDNNTFMYPYGIQLTNLYTLNSYKYFYENFNSEVLDSENLGVKKRYTSSIVSLSSLSDSELNLVSVVKMKNLMNGNFKSHSILERRSEFFDIPNWDKNFYLYKVSANFYSIKNVNKNPFEYSAFIESNNFYENKLLASISYSKFWKITNQRNEELQFSENSYGLIEIQNVQAGDTLTLKYFNPLIYIGMFITLLSFGIFLKFSFRKL
jgi:hypothetical protein